MEQQHFFSLLSIQQTAAISELDRLIELCVLSSEFLARASASAERRVLASLFFFPRTWAP